MIYLINSVYDPCESKEFEFKIGKEREVSVGWFSRIWDGLWYMILNMWYWKYYLFSFPFIYHPINIKIIGEKNILSYDNDMISSR